MPDALIPQDGQQKPRRTGPQASGAASIRQPQFRDEPNPDPEWSGLVKPK
jgi:hypothetical protein